MSDLGDAERTRSQPPLIALRQAFAEPDPSVVSDPPRMPISDITDGCPSDVISTHASR